MDEELMQTRRQVPTRRQLMQTDKKESPKGRQKQDEMVDLQMKDSFPASDPPSYSGGKHIIGAPKARESNAPKPDSRAMKDAERKVKDGSAKDPTIY